MIGVVLLSVLLPLQQAQVTPELRQAVEAGMNARQAGDLKTAAEQFRKVVQMAPQIAAGHVSLGGVYHDQQDYEHAVPELRKALELNPELPGAQLMLGTSLLALGYAAEAIPHFEKTRTIDMLGIALVEAGREREGIDRLEAALETRPNDPDLLYYLGQAYVRLAKRVVDKVAATDSPRKSLIAAEANAASGRREAAAKDFHAALNQRPSLRGVHMRLGELALESGDFPAAEKEFALEVKLAPGSAAAAYRYGSVLLNRGESAGALQQLRRANELKPEMPETLIELGKAEAASGNLPQAEKALLEVVALEPQSALAETAHFQLSQIYRRGARIVDADRENTLFRELRAKRTGGK